MATVTSCPSCGKALPVGGRGGFVRCSNPACAKVIEIGAPVPGGSAKTAPRAPGDRPELLDRLPTSFFLSAPMMAVGGVCVGLYGMVLFAVLSARRNAPAPPDAPVHEVVAVAPAPAAAATPAAPADSVAGKPAEPPKPPEPPIVVEAPKPPTRPEPSPQPGNTQVAAATPKPAPAPAATPATPTPAAPARPTWGVLAFEPGADDCQIKADGSKLTISIPGALHVLSTDLRTMNAPRLLTTAKGDFVASVTVAGKIMPGTDPLKKPATLPFTFQGAGLLVWVDEQNYLRFERSSFYDIIEGKRLHRVLVEHCRDGRTVSLHFPARDTDLDLKLERHGSELRCSYNPDGKTWVEVKRQLVAFPNEVKVGVSASNASPKPFPARLVDFTLDTGEAAAAKGN